MKMKFSVLLVVSFSLGFVLHWFIANTQVQSVIPFQPNVLGKTSSNQFFAKQEDHFITYIDYDGKRFEPSAVIIKKGNYIAITNKSSDQLMWLISDNTDLNTKRGYGEGEKLQLTLLEEGEFKVVDKLNPSVSLSVKVD